MDAIKGILGLFFFLGCLCGIYLFAFEPAQTMEKINQSGPVKAINAYYDQDKAKADSIRIDRYYKNYNKEDTP